MGVISTLWAFLTAFWMWFWANPLTRFLGLAFFLGFWLKPWFAAIQLFRQVGAEMSGGGIYTRGHAISSTTMRLFSDYGSAILWIVMWLISAVWLDRIGLGFQIARVVVVTLGMAIYAAFLYISAGASMMVVLAEFLDDATGLAALLFGLRFLFTPDSISMTANELIAALQKALG